ncbi:MAG: NAD(P)/FAD-dependent oxidoreductase [Propionibacteriaceae bacterium]|nr:NAD(P)/FAD-dependent oxidoreductase [Propionibacteriaceae bacterium]
MSRIVILGAGIAGHTAAMHLSRWLRRGHTITVVSPQADWNWIPSNVWVGVGRMRPEQVTFPLAPLYQRRGIAFEQARATVLYPEGTADDPTPQVEFQRTGPERDGETGRIGYDYLVNATGPKLNFAATPGLGPDGHTVSICTAAHATGAAQRFAAAVARVQAGEHLRFVIGTGHGTCTCQGAAFEYTFNVEHELREAGLRDRAEVVYLTNEADLGDFGVGGLAFTDRGYLTSSKLWTESLFRERDVRAITGAGVTEVTPTAIRYEQLDGSFHELPYDFAMLLPPFRGVGLTVLDRSGADISDRVFNPGGFMKVDADYAAKPYGEWRAEDWPRTYECAAFPNIFAPGIAFAPPHAISQPRQAPDGTVIAPAPPRTGMPSGVMAHAVAETIRDRVLGRTRPAHHASLAEVGAACVASAGAGFRHGSAASMTMYPVVPDRHTYPATGRHPRGNFGEIGLAGHWVKYMLHFLFIWKAKGRPFWTLIPE